MLPVASGNHLGYSIELVVTLEGRNHCDSDLFVDLSEIVLSAIQLKWL